MLIKRKLAQGEIFLALVLWGAGLTGAALGCPVVLQWLYFFAWYPLILFLDGLLYRLRGDSWLLDRPRDLLKMAFWSVTVWLVFEAFNLVLQNWGYAGVLANPWVRWPGYALAFATVLPGVLLGAEVLAALGAWRGRRGRPREVALRLGARWPCCWARPAWSCPWFGPAITSPWSGAPASFSWTPSSSSWAAAPSSRPGSTASAGSTSACWPPGCSAASGGRPGTMAPRPNGSIPCRS